MVGRHWRVSCDLPYHFNDELDGIVENRSPKDKSRRSTSWESLTAVQGGVAGAWVRTMVLEEPKRWLALGCILTGEQTR